MTEKTEVINTRFSEREKQIVEQYAAACGLSRSEYLRKRALGYEPRPALGDSFYQLYSKLCDLCNQSMTVETEKALLELITDRKYLNEDLYSALRYAANDKKTDKKMYVSAINAQAIVVGLCYANGLSPIADKYGWRFGFLAAIMHYLLVTSVPTLHGGFCLYNGGFTAALICIILVPELERFFRTKEERKLAKVKPQV